MRDLEPVIQAFEAYLDGLPPDSAIAERAHAKGVAACAVRLAALRDEDPALALIAGMLHDLRRVAGGDTSRKHGRTGAALVAPLLDSWDGLSKEDRRLVRRAIRRHGRKRRIDDAFSELIKDADIWQSSHQGESYESGSPKAVRLLVAERQHALGTIDPMAGWPPPSTPPRVARRLFEACQAFAASLAPVILHEKNHPAPSRHAIHALRQQARALHALLGHLAPLVPDPRIDRMRTVVDMVLGAVGPVRDIDVLLLWLQKSAFVNSHGNPDMSPEAVNQRRRVPLRLAEEREIRYRRAAARIRTCRGDLPLFVSADVFRVLEELPQATLDAFRTEVLGRFRHRMAKDAAHMAEKSGMSDPARHRFRIRAKESRTILECLYEQPNGSHPAFSALLSALSDLCALLGAHQDAIAGSRLLKRVLKGGHGGWTGNADLQARWQVHCRKLASHLARRAPSMCFAIRKLF